MSSRPYQYTPPTASGSQDRDCDTKENPVCWVEMGRSQLYFLPSTSQAIGRQRFGVAVGPASIPWVMS